MVRGRLLADQQLIRHFGRVDRLACRYDEYLSDILDNRILAAALGLCSRRVRGAALGRRIRRLEKLFLEVCSCEGGDFRRARQDVYYHRLNEVYREPHDLAFLIADALGVQDLFSGASAKCFAFMLDMNRLFELFVSTWVSNLFAGEMYRVRLQRKDKSIIRDASNNAAVKSVVPDVLVTRARPELAHLPMDAKYKRYDVTGIRNPDIYQAFLYAFAYGTRAEGHPPTALLLYPASSAIQDVRRFHIQNVHGRIGAEIQLVGVHIPSVLEELSSDKPRFTSTRMRQTVVGILGYARPSCPLTSTPEG